MSSTDYRDCPPASLFKQIAAMVYDSFLIMALLVLVTTIAFVINGGEIVRPTNPFRLLLLLTIFTFYAWFWHRSGQTLGMSAWKIRIVSDFGGNPSWGICYLRLMFALISLLCFGLGFLWRLFKPYTWHDKLSQTSIVDVSSLARPREKTGADAV